MKADPFPPLPVFCRGLRSSSQSGSEISDDEFDRDLRSDGWLAERRSGFLLRSSIRVCGVLLLVVGVLIVLRNFRPSSTARRVENAPSSYGMIGAELAPQILAFEVQHSPPDALAEELGAIGVSSWESHGDHDVRVRARLEPPAYCYLIAFDPDGQFRIAYPADPEELPSLSSEIRYETDSGRKTSQKQGAGLQAWLLMAARNPLPSFAEWSATHRLRWRSVQAEGVWRFDGRCMERLQPGNRRDLMKMFDSPVPFAEVCSSLGKIDDFDTIEGLAYPVRPTTD